MATKPAILERDIEAKLVREVKRRGGLSYKFTSPGRAGVPDRIVIVPDPYNTQVVFVELKTRNGSLQRNQINEINTLREKGANVRVVYGEDQMLDLVDELFPKCPGRRPKRSTERSNPNPTSVGEADE